jgi:asparagine synthase (glutamine-hydrolysing)
MCGIIGAVGVDLTDSQVERAVATLRHRGPDGSGYRWDAERRAVLGHTRLSIIDLSSAGAQPMANEDGSLLLTMNGEIYNHAALRRDLERKGHAFRGACDAEVILHLFEEKGMGLLDDLHGMFAFALYDQTTKRLHLARDRLGIKPLHWYHDGKRFAFASELKGLAAIPGLDLAPDATAYYDFLTYQFVPAPKTIYKRALKLPPAHHLVVDGHDVKLHRYWDVDFSPDPKFDAEAACEELSSLLRTTVADHLVSDVPVGIFLSAGVDSGLIAAAANEAAGSPLTAFTIGFPERGNDELAEAAEVAQRLGSPHVAGRFSLDELMAGVAMMPGLFDEPFADHSALPMIGLTRLAAARMKVVLSGDGGDETHLGYGRYLKGERRRFADTLGDAIAALGLLAPLAERRGAYWLRKAAEDAKGRNCHRHGGIPRETKRAFIDVTGAELRDYDEYWLYAAHDRPELSPYARQQYLDLKTYLPDGILTKVDRTAMRFGLEVRPPLLDHRMVELAARLPDTLKNEGGVQKAMLRRLLARRLPRETVYARKRAFSVPIEHFVRERGLFRLERDLDVLGAFRIEKKRMEQVLDPRRESQKFWIISQLERFLSPAVRDER